MLRLVNTDKVMQERLELLYSRTWHKEKFKFVHGDAYYPLYFPDVQHGQTNILAYAVVKDDNPDDIVGYIRTDTSFNNLYISCAVNFTDDKVTMGNAIHDLIAMAVEDHYHKIAWSVISGNPIQDTYAKWATKLGGKVDAVHRDNVKTWDGCYHDMTEYSVILDLELPLEWRYRYAKRYQRRKDKMLY